MATWWGFDGFASARRWVARRVRREGLGLGGFVDLFDPLDVQETQLGQRVIEQPGLFERQIPLAFWVLSTSNRSIE